MTKRAVSALVLLAVFVVWGTSGATAQSDGLTIGRGTVIRGAEGDVVELGRIPVDRSLAGPLCTVHVSVMNQASVHPGSDILIQSNDTTLVLSDVEASPDKVTTGSGSVALADEILVSVRLGPDGRFSGGMTVTVDYSLCPPETTTSEPDPAGPTVTAPPNETTVSTTPATTTPATTTPTTTGAEPATTEVTEPAGPEASEPSTTTTVGPATVTSEASPTVTTGPAGPQTDTLPVTGSSAWPLLVAVGAFFVLSGLGLGWVGRSSRRRC